MVLVRLAVYDLSNGMATQMSQMILGQRIEAIYHTGVVVYGHEYYFGGGIQISPEGAFSRHNGLHPMEMLELGETNKTKNELESWLLTIQNRFTQATYNLLSHNCNNFSDEVCRWLIGSGIPSRIVDLPQRVFSTPGGAMLRPMLEQMIANDEDITKICTSKITNMEHLLHTGSFNEPSTFNQDIGSWDVSNVTNMFALFAWCGDFNQNISYWDVGSVTNMQGMFAGAISFNQPIGEWDMSSVENIRAMFNVTHSFNQPIGNWDVSNVSDLTYLFQAAYSFNQDISSWDVSNVTDMFNTFYQASSFNQDVSSWDVSNVTIMQGMFYEAYSFNQDISSWDVINVTDMDGMLEGAMSFNQDLSTWEVSNVVTCFDFCYNAPNWTLPKPNFSNCTNDLGCD